MLAADGSAAGRNLKIFGIMIIVFEAVILLFYGIFVRYLPGTVFDGGSYAVFLALQAMLVVGFALFRTFGKGYAYSVMLYTLLINAMVLQIYILWIRFVQKAVITGFNQLNDNIYISVADLIGGCGCVFACLIAYSALLGRVGPKDIFIMSQFCLVGYCFNAVICSNRIRVFDPAGTSFIHVYGSVFGLVASFILGRKVKPVSAPQTSGTSMIFSLLGTVFLWVYFPIFNSSFAASGYNSYIIALNTLQALLASCLSTFAFTSLLGKRIVMQDILNATLSGGVAIGIVSNISYTPLNAVITGICAGLVATAGFRFLSPILRDRVGLYDACGVMNLHLLPAILGGIISSIIVWSYKGGYDINYAISFAIPNVWNQYYDSFGGQGFRQFAAILCSIAFGVLFGGVGGFVMSLLYTEDGGAFYNDGEYIVVNEKEGEPLIGV